MPSLAHAQSVLSRRRFLAGSVISVAALGVYALEIERHVLTTVQKTVLIRNLPTAFHGFKIAQLSDFHYRSYDEPFFIRHAVKSLNALQPDLVAMTGDYITSHRAPTRGDVPVGLRDADECAEILSGIRCPLRFCSLGNHDAYLAPAIRERLRKHGLTPLNNEFTAIDVKGDRLWVAGLADAYFDIPNIATTIPRRKVGEPILLLGHEPDFADTVVEHTSGVDLMLAGHTHGGQVRFPFVPPMLLPAMGDRYVEGLFALGKGTQLYVNRGLGCMHLPIRFNCPPELTLLTLQPA
jgi:predicted MPP superfamily phosphohydrolase